MLSQTPTQTRFNLPPQDAQQLDRSCDVINLGIRGKVGLEWLMQLINSQADYFSRESFSDRFRSGEQNAELQRHVNYLQSVRKEIQHAIQHDLSEGKEIKIGLTVTLSRK